MKKRSVTETPFEPGGISVSDFFPLFSPLLSLIAVDVGSHPRQSALQRTCLKENRSHVRDEETEIPNWQEAVSFLSVTDIKQLSFSSLLLLHSPCLTFEAASPFSGMKAVSFALTLELLG